MHVLRTRSSRTAMAASVVAATVAAFATYLVTGTSAAPAAPRASSVQHAPSPREKASLLFSESAKSGSLVPSGTRGEYELTLNDIDPQALYFTDRPGDEVGVVGITHLLDGLFGKGQHRPNAAVSLPGSGDMMGLTIESARYAAGSRTLRFQVRAMHQGPGPRKAHGRTDVVLPRRFGHASMFIDDIISHSCDVTINYPYPPGARTNTAMNLLSSSHRSSDTWYTAPPSTLNNNAGFEGTSYWADSGGIFEGCSNTVVYSDDSPGFADILTITTTDPWTGPNTATCTTTNQAGYTEDFHCLTDPTSSTNGVNVEAVWDITD